MTTRAHIIGLVAIVAVSVAVTYAAKAPPSGTVAVADGSTLQLGGTVWFDWTAETLPRRASDPSIEIVCYDGSGAFVWVTAGLADSLFVLGGTSSHWWDVGGSATCVASLYYLTPTGNAVNIHYVDSVEFDAASS